MATELVHMLKQKLDNFETCIWIHKHVFMCLEHIKLQLIFTVCDDSLVHAKGVQLCIVASGCKCMGCSVYIYIYISLDFNSRLQEHALVQSIQEIHTYNNYI